MPRSVRLVLACIAASLVAATAPAGAGAAGWEPITPALNGTGGQIGNPSVAVDDLGNVYAAWTEGTLMEVSKRPVGGVFETPQTLDPTSNSPSSSAQIGVDGAGNAIVVWIQTQNSDTHQIRQATRPTGASAFGAPSDVNPTTQSGYDTPSLGVNRAGEAVLAVQTPNSGTGFARLFLGSATGGFTSPSTRYDEGPSTSIFPPDAAINEAGDAVVAWRGFSSGSTSMRAVYRVHGQAFGPREDILPPDATAKHEPSVAIDSQGNAMAVWDENAGGQIRAYTRPPAAGVPWAKVSDLDAPQQGNGAPDVAFDAGRNAVAAWNGGGELRDSTQAPGGVFAQPPQSLTGNSENPAAIGVDSGVSGTIALTWSTSGASPLARATVRPNGGPFGQIDTLSPSGHGGGAIDVAVDPLGNAAAVWVDTNPPGSNPRLVTAEYDVRPPQFASKSLDLAPAVGQPASYSATATDDWSQPAIGWDFGDGTSVLGGSVSHAYTKAGTYLASVTALDGVGNISGQNFAVTVADAPTRGVDFNASSISGKVFVSVPKNAPAGRILARQPAVQAAAAIKPPKGYRKFRLLGANDNIPIGSILDATNGVTQLKMATNALGTTTQLGKFSQGVFKTQQSRHNALTTALMLGGGNFRSACKPFGFLAKKRRRPHRRLFGNVHGRFRTRGRHSAATVRGTQYLVKDECKGTTTRVIKGSVTVRDLVKHRTRIVRAGHSYLAASRRKK